MTTIAESAPYTSAVVDALKTIGRPVGDAARPQAPSKPPLSFFPYFVAYTGTATVDGTLGDPRSDGLHRTQLTSVGRDRAGAEWARDQARAVLLDPGFAVDGHTVVMSEQIVGLDITRDDDVTPPLFYAVDIYQHLVIPD